MLGHLQPDNVQIVGLKKQDYQTLQPPTRQLRF